MSRAKAIEMQLANATHLPQAKDDCLTIEGGTTGDITDILLANDLGGSAKHIVSISDAPSWISFNDGIVSYASPTAEDATFNYTIQMASGAFSTATVTISSKPAESLIQNGDFEGYTGPLANVTWGRVSIPGWTNTGDTIELWRPPYPTTSPVGSGQYIELDSDSRVDVISQTLDAIAGREYTLSFDYASRALTAGVGNTTDSFEVFWNGDSLGIFDPETTTSWTRFTKTVVGADGPDVLEFRDAGANDGQGALIDNVSLVGPSDWITVC
jgi:hypothetical protein